MPEYQRILESASELAAHDRVRRLISTTVLAATISIGPLLRTPLGIARRVLCRWKHDLAVPVFVAVQITDTDARPGWHPPARSSRGSSRRARRRSSRCRVTDADASRCATPIALPSIVSITAGVVHLQPITGWSGNPSKRTEHCQFASVDVISISRRLPCRVSMRV
jgi:hypothetical protein